MKIRLVGSSVGGAKQHQYLMSYVINDSVAIDAGCIGFISPPAVQKRIEHIFLSHSHIDHLASLPIFLDNIYEPGPDCPTIHAGQAVQDCLRTDLFNDRVWPDLVRLSEKETPFMKMELLEDCQPVEVADLTITPIALNHVVPSFGFIIESEESAIAIVSDTSPTDAIWQHANRTANLRAVYLEASFPNSMQWLAEASKHLTPEMFQAEASKLEKDVPLIAIHIKPDHHDTIVEELNALEMANLQIGEPERVYEF